MVKKEEQNDIIQYLLPQLTTIGININQVKVDVTTENTGNKRGDVWVSRLEQKDKKFEENIICLIEAKHKKCNIGDMDWRDAMKQGKEKSIKQNLNYYIVTNCLNEVRYYNSHNDEEITLDGKILTNFVGLDVLIKIQSQVNIDNSDVAHKVNKNVIEFTEAEFRRSLRELEHIYRSAGIKKGDERIDPTVSFVVLKYISEKEAESRTLSRVIQLWDDFSRIVDGTETRDLSSEFITTVSQIWGNDSPHRDNQYKDFKNLVNFPAKLKHNHYSEIYKELNSYHFHGGAKFDLFGTIYEEYATQSKKKEFGEFYTRRHITNMIAKLLLRNERQFRNLKICDPACGTGGFLTEAFKVLNINYTTNNQMNNDVLTQIQNNTFWGYDNDPKSVARTKLNMFLVGDGHNHIYENDSLVGWNNNVKWKEEEFDYILANPPMGSYKGDADVNNYTFTNESRYELLFLEQIIKATKPGGGMAIVINDGSLETPSRVNFRKKILENCNISSVISLTKFAFAPYTKEKTYVLFMQKKQVSDVGNIQDFPIWHYIVDYDGYANSDKRFRTKYHDDLAELESKFDGAMQLINLYSSNKGLYSNSKEHYERKVNDRELEEGLWGYKFRFVEMHEVNEGNFYNLLSEKHLRPYVRKSISIDEFENKIGEIYDELITASPSNNGKKEEIKND
ncbi:hypothetical protein CWR48_05040 [Oceanobacillus arenosus]|uniref:site-specific DNA-methyltransferase (adenine-specific) n=1 Tax=Oceanobacillus arenosus TaxID=1229153 RepID=A0A3D8PXP7_9BACI|nr:N-6 DNA methylase [Oceanobacillus arenosus]RDW20091.1 hypothetical protein CWR48_05040 [Oceanobacillus arenosus]